MPIYNIIYNVLNRNVVGEITRIPTVLSRYIHIIAILKFNLVCLNLR